MSGRRCLWRWAARSIRFDWRSTVGVLVLTATTVALGVAGVVAVYNLTEPPAFRYGLGHVRAAVSGDGAAAVALLEDQANPFGVVHSASLRGPGSAAVIPVRAQDPDNAVTAPLLALVDGAWPTGPDEVAVTDAAPVASRRPGDTIELAGASRTIVGVVENPTDLADEFVLAQSLDPLGIDPRFRTAVLLVDADPADVTFPAGTLDIAVESRGGPGAPTVRTQAAMALSVVVAVALLVVALLAGTSFAVSARRRARQYGLLAAAGATPRQLRRVAGAEGALLGALAAVAGAVVGAAGAAVVVPRFEEAVGHRIDLTIPWWTVAPSVVLAVAAAAVAARWPARALSTQPVAELLAARRPRPAPTRRSTGLGLVGVGVGTPLAIIGTTRLSGMLLAAGILAALAGLLLLSPVLVKVIGRLGGRLPLSGRMASRTVARYQARSAAVVAALTVALGIPTGLAVVTASIDRYQRSQPPNLADDTAIAWLPGGSALDVPVDLKPPAAETVAGLRAAVPGAAVVPIEVAVEADDPGRPMDLGPGIGTVPATTTVFGIRPFDGDCTISCDVASFGDLDEDGSEIEVTTHAAWIATPELLAALGIEAGGEGSAAHALSRFEDAALRTHRGQREDRAPAVAAAPGLPPDTTIAPTLIQPTLVADHGWQTITVGWLVAAGGALSADDLTALTAAAGDELSIESTVIPSGRSGTRAVATAAGAVLSLGIVVATLGLVAADAAEDLRLLQSIGAGPRHRRRLSAATAAILAAAGAVVAVPAGFLGQLVLVVERSTDFPFVVPWVTVAVVVVVFPALAGGLGWLWPGRRATALAAPTGRMR